MRRKARRGGGRQIEVTIDALGGRGDGLAAHDGRPVFVAGALPGERVLVRLKGQRAGGYVGEVLELIEIAPERVEPPCPHFGPCGGCSLQHLADERYGAWKLEQVVESLARRGLQGQEVRPLLRIGAQTRRRAGLAAFANTRGVLLGFHERSGNRVVDAPECRILTPNLLAVATQLRTFLPRILQGGDKLDLALTQSETGIDLLVTANRAPDLASRETLAEAAASADWARVSWRTHGELPEPLAERRRPSVTFGATHVELPAGAFLQPTAEGETALVAAVGEALVDCAGRVVDLFAGLGTFTFPLVPQCQVHAVEGDEVAIGALGQAARDAGLAPDQVSTEVRNLARQPLTAEELSAYDAVVFDPPRTGARSQAQEIASADVGRVVGVSCNPNTFGRDARILVDGGYRLDWIQPIDQFPWSGHVELVAAFSR